MLLVGDLHINSRIKDRVVDVIRKYVSDNSNEKNIIFLGDYVYHFSYDRSALLSLYTLFLELFSQGKNVYILAGNHDWIGNTFVFEEAKRTYEMITDNSNGKANNGKIEFITTPKIENIEGEDVLFLPYFLEIDDTMSSGVKSKDINLYPSTGSEGQISPTNDKVVWEIEKTIKTLFESKNKNEIISSKINQILLEYVKKYEKLTVIHHYYTEGINFPGQRGRFYFNDIALSKLFCDLENIKMISGHLHQGFIYKNYLCTGSLWNTSPLEVNHVKMMFKYSNENVEGTMFFINPYFLISEELQIKNDDVKPNKIDEEFMNKFILNVIGENQKNYNGSNIWNVDFQKRYDINNKDISISMKVEEMNYDKIYSYIDEELYKKFRDVKLKKNLVVTKDLFDKLNVEGKNLSAGFSDWKGLLKEYLTNKYPEDFEKYLDFLKKEKII